MSHLTDAQIEAIRKNYDPNIGPRNVDEWMYCSTDSPNPLNNIAAVNALLAHVLAETLNLQKVSVERVTKLIEQLNDLKSDLEKYRPASIDAEGKLGTTYEEAVNLVKRLKASGVEISAVDQAAIDTAFATKSVPTLKGSAWTKWSTALQGRSESLSAQSEQETLRLQTFTNRYTQATDQASNTLQKDQQSRANINRNIGS